MVFLVLLGNSWISSKQPRITEVFWISSKNPRISMAFGFPAKKPRKPRENQESKNQRFSGRCLVHYKILDSWFSRGFLGFPGFWISSKKQRITRFFLDFQQKTRFIRVCLDFQQKIQELLGFFWISRFTRGFFLISSKKQRIPK